MSQKRSYLKLETRYVKTVFRNGIYDKFCIRMSVFWIFDKIGEKHMHVKCFRNKKNEIMFTNQNEIISEFLVLYNLLPAVVVVVFPIPFRILIS